MGQRKYVIMWFAPVIKFKTVFDRSFQHVFIGPQGCRQEKLNRHEKAIKNTAVQRRENTQKKYDTF